MLKERDLAASGQSSTLPHLGELLATDVHVFELDTSFVEEHPDRFAFGVYREVGQLRNCSVGHLGTRYAKFSLLMIIFQLKILKSNNLILKNL